jgi:hypothetical protein
VEHVNQEVEQEKIEEESGRSDKRILEEPPQRKVEWEFSTTNQYLHEGWCLYRARSGLVAIGKYLE